MHIQKVLGSDIATCLISALRGDAPADVQEVALERTTRWAARCRVTERATGQALFGIVQGGIDTARRLRHAAEITKLDFDGHALGGLAVGEKVEDTRQSGSWTRWRTRSPRTDLATSWGGNPADLESEGSRPASTCSIASCRPATPATDILLRGRRPGQHPQRRQPNRPRSDRPDLSVLDVPDPLPGLPATSLPGQRDPVRAPRNPAQPHVLRPPRGKFSASGSSPRVSVLDPFFRGCYATAEFADNVRYLAPGVPRGECDGKRCSRS